MDLASKIKRTIRNETSKNDSEKTKMSSTGQCLSHRKDSITFSHEGEFCTQSHKLKNSSNQSLQLSFAYLNMHVTHTGELYVTHSILIPSK